MPIMEVTTCLLFVIIYESIISQILCNITENVQENENLRMKRAVVMRNLQAKR